MMYLEVITPEEVLFKGQVSSVKLPAGLGLGSALVVHGGRSAGRASRGGEAGHWYVKCGPGPLWSGGPGIEIHDRSSSLIVCDVTWMLALLSQFHTNIQGLLLPN